MKKSQDHVLSILDQVATRKFRGLVFRSALLWLGCIALLLAAALITDWFVAWRSASGRWAGSLAVVLSVLASLFYFSRRLGREPDRAAAARALDEADPEHVDRWSTYAALQPKGAGATGSAAMTEAFVRETRPRSESVDVKVIDPLLFPARRAWFLFASIATVAGFILFFLGQGSPRLFARFLAPWAHLPLTRISEPSVPPAFVLKGGELSLSPVLAGKKAGRVWLEIEDSDPRRLSRESDEPVFRLENLRETFRYRYVAGDAETAWQTVRVTSRPRLQAVKVTVKDPPYSTRPPRSWNRLPDKIVAIAGSELEATFESDRELARAHLEIRRGEARLVPLPGVSGRKEFEFRETLAAPLDFRPGFTSTEGFEAEELDFCRVEVVADRPPEVRLTDDSSRELLSPLQDLEIGFEARDDVGIAAAEAVFSITDPLGATRTVAAPIDLGEQAGNREIAMKAEIPLNELGIQSGEKVTYSVRVRDNSKQQGASAGQSSEKKPETGLAGMEKRPLPGGGASAESKSRDLSFANTESINQIEPTRKKLLAIEQTFGQVKALTRRALDQTRSARAATPPPGGKIDTAPLYQAIVDAGRDLRAAGEAITAVAQEAPGTPYEFISIQLQSLANSWLDPARSRLAGAMEKRPRDLPPREDHRQTAEDLLTRAMAELEGIAKAGLEARSEVQTEFAMREMMNHYIAQVKDIPVLLEMGGGDGGSPYQREPGEVSRAQAEAALKRLESKKELYQKTAQLLRQHPELWKKYLDQSKVESSIFRDQLEALASRHSLARQVNQLGLEGKDPAAPAAELVARHQGEAARNLARTLEKARTWNQASGGAAPPWLDSLEKASRSVPETPREKSARLAPLLDAAISGLRQDPAAASGSLALRLGEMQRIRTENALAAEWIHSSKPSRAALLEEASIASQTQQLAGKIELEGARLDSLHPEVASLGKAFQALMHDRLLPALSESVMGLREAPLPALASQRHAEELFAEALAALDRYVVAAIREMDKTPAQASAEVAGAPQILADSLEALEQKLAEEKEMSESFGIPCCRPTNFQVMPDWEKVAENQSQNQPPQPKQPGQMAENSPPDGSEKTEKTQAQPSQSQPSQQGGPGQMAESSPQDPAKAGQPPSSPERSQVDVAAMARREAIRQAEELSAMLAVRSSKPGKDSPAASAENSARAGASASGSAQGPAPLQAGSPVSGAAAANDDWNRLRSTLRREVLQERSASLPEAYRKEIEAYFRELSRWKFKEE